MLAKTTAARPRANARRRPRAACHGLVTQERAVRARGRGTVARLLAAGLAEFDERGFRAVAVDDIVRRERLTRHVLPVLRQQGRFLRALSQEALHAMDRITGEFPVVTPDRAGRAALRKWVGDFCDTYAAHATVLGMLSQAQVVGPDAWEEGLGHLFRLADAMSIGMAIGAGRHGNCDGGAHSANGARLNAVACLFRPAVIAGRRYVDGGVRSATSADLLTEAGLDEVYVLAPTASLVTGRPRTPPEGVERALRRWMTFALRRETARLRSCGVKVTVLTPGPEDPHAIGANLMDPGRRHDVFETSLRTSVRSVADAMPQQQPSVRTV